MKRKISGDSITQYAIIVSLIALFLVPTLSNMGKAIRKNLDDYRIAIKKTNNQAEKNLANKADETILKDTIVPGELGGTVDNPKSRCINDVCSVDFGEFVFNNIPKNFKEFVETSGFSGGTSMLASLLEDVARETADTTTPETTNLINQLAMQGHILAGYEAEIETATVDLVGNPDLNVTSTIITPSNHLKNGGARNDFELTLAELNALYVPPMTPEKEALINLVNYLSTEITMLADNMGDLGGNITGASYTTEELEALLAPATSATTHLDSAIICNTGGGTDSGDSCI